LGPCLTNIDEADNGVQGVANIVFGIINFFIIVGSAIAVLMVVYGGLQWMTGWSITNEKGDQTGMVGRKTVFYALAALVAMGLVYIIISIIISLANILTGNINNSGTAPSGSSSGYRLEEVESAKSYIL
jgi:ABC-type Fe3+ transport system permease subunit